jgi:hypothetical protein
MDIEHAARRLAERINPPRGAITIVPWHGEKRVEIRVWYASNSESCLASLPAWFEGYPVVAEPRPEFRAQGL